MRLGSLLICACTLFAFHCGDAFAQSWPAKPIRIIVPWSPGGSVDVLARVMSPHYAETLGQPVVVENRPGAGGNIGADLVAKAAADGHALLFSANSTHVMNPSLFETMPFKAIEDFAPIAMLTRVMNVLVVHPSVPARTVAELIDLAKSRPGGLTYASAGIGSQPHLSAELFRKMTGANIVHVPYKGGAPANADLVAGHVQLMFTAYANVQDYVGAGKLKLLAVAEGSRAASLPAVPTIGETAPGFDVNAYYGVFAPKGTPGEIVARLHTETNRILALPQVRAKLSPLGLIPAPMPTQEFENTLRTDLEKWTRLIKELGVRAN